MCTETSNGLQAKTQQGAGWLVLTLPIINCRHVIPKLSIVLRRVSAQAVTPSEAFLGHLQNSRVHMMESVAPSSRKQYATGFNRWQLFVYEIGTTWDMQVVPEGVSAALCGLSFTVACFVGFLAFLRDGGDNNEPIEPHSACNYMAGARFFLKNHNVDTSECDASEAIKTTKQGMRLAFRTQHGNTVADRQRLPFTMDLIVFCITTMLAPRLFVMDHFTELAFLMGIGFIFRKCEYIKCAQTDHHLRAMDVTFVFRLMSGEDVFVLAHLAYDMDPKFLTEVIIFIRSAKNDYEGVGNKVCCGVRVTSDTVPYCLATEMFVFNKLARPHATHPFLSYRGQWVYDGAHLSQAMKTTAVHKGLDPNRFAQYSLRIAAACILAALDYPDSAIRKAGRWKSDVFIRYIRQSHSTMQKISGSIFSTTSLNFDDVRRVATGL